MDRKQTIQLLTILGTNYRTIDEKLKDKNTAKILLETWNSCLEDIDYDLCMLAVKKIMIENTFPPTIHDVRVAIMEITRSKEEDSEDIELWNEALKMIRKGSYMTTDEFNTHSELVKKFFGDVGALRDLAQADSDTVSTVVKGQFLKQIKTLRERKEKFELLPEKMQKTILELKVGETQKLLQ